MSVSISGGGAQSITTNPPADCAAVKISPDGKRMAYLGLPDRDTIQVVNIDGTGRKEIVRFTPVADKPRDIWDFSWSPNSMKIAMLVSAIGQLQGGETVVNTYFGWLYYVSSSGGAKPVRINTVGIETGWYFPPAWSPDSRWTLEMDGKTPSDAVEYYPYAYRIADSHSVMVAYDDTLQFGVGYDWSPDSRYISHIFFEKPPQGCDLEESSPQEQMYLVLAEIGSQAAPAKQCIPLPDPSASYPEVWSVPFGARWSPDQSSFLVFNTHTHSLYVLGKDGTIRNEVISLEPPPDITNWAPDAHWSPDGKWIIFVRDGVLGILRPDGTDLRWLASGVGRGPIIWK
jgi:Tol biopolymer transport system component